MISEEAPEHSSQGVRFGRVHRAPSLAGAGGVSAPQCSPNRAPGAAARGAPKGREKAGGTIGIGRGWGRGKGERSGGAGSFKKKKKEVSSHRRMSSGRATPRRAPSLRWRS